MIAIITTYLTATLGTAAAATVLMWVIGLFTGAAWYQTLRGKYGRQMYRIGQGWSRFSNSKIGAPLVERIEDAAADWVGLGVEQLFAGARADNLVKLEKQLDRMQDVGSATRAKAIADKIEALEAAPPVMQTEQDAAMFRRAFEAGDKSINERLGG